MKVASHDVGRQDVSPSTVFARSAEASCLVASFLLFMTHHSQHPAKPITGLLDSGWWSWFDQGYYLRAAQALARLDFSVTAQNYEPGYALLATPFVHVTPSDPFLIPDLACLLIACWLFGGISKRVAAVGVWSRPVGMALFMLSTVAYPAAAVTWVVPWTTTPIAPLLFGAVLATLNFVEAPRAPPSFLAGLACSAIAAFRPGDSVAVAVPCAAVILARLARMPSGSRRRSTMLFAGVCGGLLGAMLFALMHAMIWGTSPSPYMLGSRAIGFNLLLVPLRWVLLVVSPSPLTEGRGLCEVFPWAVTGIGTLVSCSLLGRRGDRTPHMLLCSISILLFLVFLSYRDLHPGGMWRYGNVHYFKWMLPVFALYTFRLLTLLLRREPKIPAVAVATMLALFCWRPGLYPAQAIMAVIVGARPGSLILPQGLPQATDAVLVAADGSWDDIYAARYNAVSPMRIYGSDGDFKAYPRPGGFLFVPLRPIARNTAVTFSEGVVLDPAISPVPVRQIVRFLPPCWLGSCVTPDLLAGRPFELGQTMPIGAPAAERYLDGGWGGPELEGRWTTADKAGLLVRLDGLQPGRDVTVRLIASAYVPPSRPYEEIRMEAAGHQVAEWRVEPGSTVTLAARIPAADITPLGNLHLSIVTPHPHEPADFERNADHRNLGLFLRTLSVDEAK